MRAELFVRDRTMNPTLGSAPGEMARPAPPSEFEEWFSEHRGTVFRYVRFRVETREVAEDVTSDVFLKAMRAFKTYNRQKSAPRTWLLTIARNAVTDHLRKLKRHGSMQVSLDRIPDLVSGLPSPEERLLGEERIQTLLNAVHSLNRRDQELLSLRYGAGLANTEIAQQLGISANAVAVRMHRVLKRLRQRVGVNPNRLPTAPLGSAALRAEDISREALGMHAHQRAAEPIAPSPRVE